MPQIIQCPSGRWTVLINNVASRMPAHWTIAFSGPDEVSGRVRESRGFLPFGIAMTSAERELSTEMSFDRYWINASYRLEIWPDYDLEARFH